MDLWEALKLISPWLVIVFSGISGMHWYYRKRDLTRMDCMEKEVEEISKAMYKLQMGSEVAIKTNIVEINALRNELATTRHELQSVNGKLEEAVKSINKELRESTSQLINILAKIRTRNDM